MRLLRLVGLGDDGALMLQTDDGTEQFALTVDEALRLACRPTPPAAPKTEKAPVIDLRPRDIQIRVRSGEDPQSIADDAGTSLEKVMRFAYPVLQERIRITDEARRGRARRGADGQLVSFGELAAARLAAHGVGPEDIRWDAFRREDGGWTVTAGFRTDEREAIAKFSFALSSRTVSAIDDVAADVLSDRPIKALAKPASPPELRASGARLAAVRNPDEARHEGADQGAAHQDRVDASAGPPSRRQKAHTRHLPAIPDDELFDQEALDSNSESGSALPDHDLPDHDSSDPTLNDAAMSPSATQQRPSGQQRRSGRTAEKPRMPSWDDILLGVRRKPE